MARPTNVDPWTTLAERLRAEAGDSRPAFSEDLHARICDGVRQCGVFHVSRRMFGRPVGLAAVGAAAASLLVAAVLIGPSWQRARRLLLDEPSAAAPPPGIAKPSSEPAGPGSGFELVTDLADRATEHFDSLVDAAGQWASLDHDARLAFESLSERLPVNLVPMSSSETSDAAEHSSGLRESADE
jgi:hypothetical protein